MTTLLKVSLFKDGALFLAGEFEVREPERAIVVPLLPEMGMDRRKAEAILGGYMHAKDVGEVTEDMGKLALVAAVYMVERGETEIAIALDAAQQ